MSPRLLSRGTGWTVTILTETRKAAPVTGFQKYSKKKKAQGEASKLSESKYLGYCCFIVYLALRPRNFFATGQEGKIGRCI